MRFGRSKIAGRLAGALCVLAVAAFACVLPAAQAADEADEAGFKSLFDGKDLTGWDGNPKFWSVQDGAITGITTAENPTPGNTFLIWKNGTVDDFVFRFSYKIVGGNSGIQYRSVDKGNWVVHGYQADFESGDTYSGILYEEGGRGILANRGQKVTRGEKASTEQIGDSGEIQKKIKKEDWNDYEITAVGNHVTHKINGVVTADFTDNEPDKRPLSGILALQLHAGPSMKVQFKDLRIKRTRLTSGTKKIVLVAGNRSHGKGDHEFNAGTILLTKCLNAVPGVVAARYSEGWPKDPTAFDNADAILFYMDGGSGHPIIQSDRLIQINNLANQGVGIACAHYAVEVPADRGGPELLQWIGGYYETGYSINPHWVADFKEFPKHAVTAGVKPFSINDEWYYNMRWPADASNVTPILAATPPDETRRTKAAAENKGRIETVAWVVERSDGGRGFGFTGGHVHKNWGDENFRKLVLNSLLWTAKAKIPEGGVSCSVSPEELGANLDPK